MSSKNEQLWSIGYAENHYEANNPHTLIRTLHGALMSTQSEAQRNKEALQNRVEKEMDRLAAEGRIDATLRSNDRTLKEKVKALESENAELKGKNSLLRQQVESQATGFWHKGVCWTNKEIRNAVEISVKEGRENAALKARVEVLRATVDHQKGLLAELEWHDAPNTSVQRCYFCRAWKSDGHDDDCPIGIALKGENDAETASKC